MIKRIVFFSITMLFLAPVFSQDFDKLMMNKQIDCSDVATNCGLYFIKYLQEEKLDSATQLIDYWETKCGDREPVFRAKVLLALTTGTYTDSLLTTGILNHIYNYKNRVDMIRNSTYYSYDTYTSYYGFIPPGQEFDQVTQELARSLVDVYAPESNEALLAEFYSGEVDTIFCKLQSGTQTNTTLSTEYNEQLDKYLRMAEMHASWVTGVWIPTGELTTLGVHPDLGFQLGAKKGKMNYDLTMTFKFINAANDYTAYRNGVPEMTNDFFGGYIGFDVGRDIVSHNGHELQITGGIAFDGFDALSGDDELDLDSESTASYNFNLGLGYRYYIRNSMYLGLRAKYNIVDYTMNDVVDLTGNAITIQFLVGGIDNVFRNDNLRALGYKLRK